MIPAASRVGKVTCEFARGAGIKLRLRVGVRGGRWGRHPLRGQKSCLRPQEAAQTSFTAFLTPSLQGQRLQIVSDARHGRPRPELPAREPSVQRVLLDPALGSMSTRPLTGLAVAVSSHGASPSRCSRLSLYRVGGGGYRQGALCTEPARGSQALPALQFWGPGGGGAGEWLS